MPSSSPPASASNKDREKQLSRTLSGATAAETHWFLLKPADIASRLEASIDDGLTSNEAAARQRRDGPNELMGGGGVSIWSILAGQVFNAMVLVLVACLAVSFGIQSWIEGGVIAAVIIINVGVGFLQEYSSAKTMDSLRSLASPNAHVIRNSKIVTIPSPEVVVGDIVEVKTGDTIPADLRLFEAVNFETDEALLTGESLPVAKDANASWLEEAKASDFDPRDIGVGDRITMAYSSSTVTKGRAKGIVVGIGMNTSIGAIAQSLRGGDSKVRKVRRNEDGRAPWHRYPAAWALTTIDIIGQFLGVNTGTPLQRTLSWLAIALFFIGCVFALFCFAANSFRGEKEIILYAIATALSMIPASLVVVLTITLAGGTRAMAARHVIVRKLDSLEALGAVTNICSDKTGTLTQGKMVVRAAWLPARGTISVGESKEPFNPTLAQLSFSPSSPAKSADQADKMALSSPSSETASPKSAAEPTSPDALLEKGGSELSTLLNIASMCSTAKVFKKEGEGWTARGDPTECAIQTFAHRFGWGRERWIDGDLPEWTQVAEYPFDSDVKRMSVIYARKEKQFAFMKGAVERLIDACSQIQLEDGPAPVDDSIKEEIFANVEALAEQGLRVLALAAKPWSGASSSSGNPDRTQIETDMTLYGLVGIYDPPRPETKSSVRMCHEAGIQVHMLTGDHAATARAIALRVGILPRNVNLLSKDSAKAMVMTAAEFDKLSDEEVDKLPLLPLVIARCAPHTKVRMIEALHRRKAFCAMTGDGVNDSPSLKRADVGVGIGSGSDVAKDASDIVLADDNFASILAAVEEGRRMFANIRKFVLHLLAGNVMQALTLLIGLAFKDENDFSVFPLAPVEILWIIMITSSLPAMGLGAEKAEVDIMRRKPHNLKMGVFAPEIIIDILVYGLVGAGCCLGVFTLIVFHWGNGDLGIDSNNNISGNAGSQLVFEARSATFATMVWILLFLAFECMDLRRSLYKMDRSPDHRYTQWMRDVWSNQILFWSVVGGFITPFPLVYIPVINDVVFKHTAISWQWTPAFVATGIFMVLAEAYKYAKRAFIRRRHAKHPEEEDGMTGVFSAWKTTDPTTKDGKDVV
ncbi:Ca2+-transporting ATPase [Rhodotorula toruloides]|uniref:P-type Na(+) transporter n=1 Tax=Rhodotorula toruloides TaxID=5286 RepID=A0A511KPQ8_RHOTO|nr:Ca2+-transporting ATPase [Rhodotorula toruloides]